MSRHRPLKAALIYGYEPSGHSSAAQAIAEELPSELVEPVHVNLSSVFPSFGPFVARAYLQVLKKTPAVWSYAYDNSLLSLAAKSLRGAVLPYYSRRLAAYLHRRGVKAVISTHAMACQMLSADGGGTPHGPLFAVVTDFRAHSYWPGRGVKAWFTHDRAGSDDLRKNGAPAERIFACGIPVRKGFAAPRSREAELLSLGLDPRLFTVLLAGGSKGLGELEEAASALRPLLGKIQLLVLCGENRRLSASLEKMLGGKKHARVFNYCKDTSPHLAAADIVAGKPGGVTAAESLALIKPLFIFAPLPGQEERNADFLARRRLALKADTAAELAHLVKRAAGEPGMLDPMKKAIVQYSRPRAARDIAARVLEELYRPEQGNFRCGRCQEPGGRPSFEKGRKTC
ncbi:MAG TPA: glycosyltransferase [Elusimicrobiales bacterium]|nr:glycosyltransferase [Elusimicrobiales bacterium]